MESQTISLNRSVEILSLLSWDASVNKKLESRLNNTITFVYQLVFTKNVCEETGIFKFAEQTHFTTHLRKL